MAETQIDRIPIAQLPSRYNITRSVIYDRLTALKIEPIRVGNKAYISTTQLQFLDELHSHIQQGKPTAEFLAKLTKVTASDSDLQRVPLESDKALVSLIEVLLTKLNFQYPREINPLAELEALEKAYKNEWLLSTSHLAKLMKLSPGTINSYKDFQRYGFRFKKCGRNGLETAWKITKISTTYE